MNFGLPGSFEQPLDQYKFLTYGGFAPASAPLGLGARPACERRHISGDASCPHSRPVLLSPLPTSAGVDRPPAGTPIPTSSSRSGPRGRTRPDRAGQGRLPDLPCPVRVPRVRTWPRTRTPASGVAPPRRSGATCGGRSSLARRRPPPPERPGDPSSGQRLRPLRPKPGSPAPPRCPCPFRPSQTDRLEVVGRGAAQLDGAGQLRGDQRAHDRQAEPARLLEVEAVGHADAVVDDPQVDDAVVGPPPRPRDPSLPAAGRRDRRRSGAAR